MNASDLRLHHFLVALLPVALNAQSARPHDPIPLRYWPAPLYWQAETTPVERCTETALAQVPGFDVVSIKPSPPDSHSSQTTYDPGRLIAQGVSLKQLVEWAYQVTSVQVSSGPAWVDSKFFDVEAEAEGEHTKDELLRMLQPALADRFKLALHHERKEMSVYVLTAGANRLKLQEAQGGRPANIRIQGAPSVTGKGVILSITGQSVSMQYLTNYLTGIFDRLVLDRTGLKSSFDFKADVALEENDIITDKRAAVTTALSDALTQLGLKFALQKESVEILVVDHAEEPSAN